MLSVILTPTPSERYTSLISEILYFTESRCATDTGLASSGNASMIFLNTI